MDKTFGIIGGTGRQGSALAKRLLRAGYRVRIGSRSEERGNRSATTLQKELSTELVTEGDNEFALKSDVIVLAIPFDQVVPLLGEHKQHCSGKVVMDMTVNLSFGKYIKTNTEDGKSSYEFIREFLPNSDIVACLKTISYHQLDQVESLKQTDFQMTTSDEAFKFTSELVKKFGLEPVRVRGKMHAHTIERMVALSIQLNKEYAGAHFGFKLV